MKISRLHDPDAAGADDWTPCAAALGFFDGIHLGHRKVIETAGEIARKQGLELAVVTFDPHPKQFLQVPGVPDKHLTPLPVKAKMFAELGVHHLCIIRFDQGFADLSPKEFVDRYLIRRRVRHVVTGFDFRYGSRGAGSMHTLELHGCGHFGVTIVSEVARSGQKVSSTLIRSFLMEGKVDKVAELLGGVYTVAGRLTRNEGGSHLTDGIAVKINDAFLLPPAGRYMVEVGIGGIPYAAVGDLTTGSRVLKIRFRSRPPLRSAKRDDRPVDEMIIGWRYRITSQGAFPALAAGVSLSTHMSGNMEGDTR